MKWYFSFPHNFLEGLREEKLLKVEHNVCEEVCKRLGIGSTTYHRYEKRKIISRAKKNRKNQSLHRKRF